MAPPESSSAHSGMNIGDARRADSSNNRWVPGGWFDSLGVPAFAAKPDGSIVAWNRRLCEESQIAEEDVLGTSCLSQLIHGPAERQEWQTLFRACTQTGKTQFCRVQLATKNQSIVTLQIRITANTSSADNESVSGAVCFVENMEQENTQNVALNGAGPLHWTDEDASQFVKTANVAIFGVDTKGNITLWNAEMARLSALSPEAAIGVPLHQGFLSTSARESLQSILNKAFAGEGTQSHELEFQPQGGDIRKLLLNVSPLERNKQSVGAMVVVQDVTDAALLHRPNTNNNSSELHETIFNSSSLIFGVDQHGNVNVWNDRTAEATGCSTNDALNKPFISTFVPQHRCGTITDIQTDALQGRGVTNYEMELRSSGGELRLLIVTASSRRNAENAISGVLYTAYDITDACKHDRAVSSMASELRQLIDTANAPIFGVDSAGDINEWNDKTAEITGYTKEEAFDCSLVETFIVPYMQDSFQGVLDNALEGRGTSNYELEFCTKSGEIRHLLVNATTRRDAENNVVGVVAVAQDVTESVQRDRAVAGMALELRQLIDTANAPIFGIDVDGNVNEWNRRTQIITGYSKEETFDLPLVETFIAPQMQQKVQDILEAALQGNETSNYELEVIAKSGEPRFMLVNATTRRDPEFNVVGVVGVAQDVTEDRKHSAELRKMQYIQATQAAKVETERNMTAYFAHELRNPLGAIDSALCAMPDDLPEPANELVRGMRLCSSFMSSIMTNLLDVRKMEEGKMTLKCRPISLRGLVTGVQKMLQPAMKPGVSLNTVCNTKNKNWVLGDEHRIQQVFTNVITNAIKYTVSGSVTLRIGWEGDKVKFECIDTGPGIPKNEQEKLFQRFVQRGGAPGTGLGLAIAKHLVDLTGGSIQFQSDPTLRPGTTCVVTMPLEPCESPDTPTAISDMVNVIEEPLKFLIIDDVKMNRVMLKRRIMKGIAPNCSLKEASTGEEALEICGNESFDVIVVDQYMEEAGGVMVGTDVVYAMRRMRIEAVIIGCSGNDLDAEFDEAGADFVWKKPMPSNEKILQDLREAMNKRKPSD